MTSRQTHPIRASIEIQGGRVSLPALRKGEWPADGRISARRSCMKINVQKFTKRLEPHVSPFPNEILIPGSAAPAHTTWRNTPPQRIPKTEQACNSIQLCNDQRKGLVYEIIVAFGMNEDLPHPHMWGLARIIPATCTAWEHKHAHLRGGLEICFLNVITDECIDITWGNSRMLLLHRMVGLGTQVLPTRTRP